MRQFGMLGFAVTLFWLVMMVAVSASAETIELVTYYPAPGGGNASTDRLHTGRATVGDPYSLTSPADNTLPNGTLIVATSLGIGPNFGGAVPAQALEVEGNVFLNSPADALVLADRAANTRTSGLQLWTAGAPKWTIGSLANGREDLHVYSHPDYLTRLFVEYGTGNVGIGTDQPTELLHVHRTGAADSMARFTTGSTGATVGDGLLVGYRSAGSANVALVLNQKNSELWLGNAGGAFMKFSTNGSVGIGPNSVGKLCITTTNQDHLRLIDDGRARVSGIGSDDLGWYISTQDNTPLRFNTNNLERMRISATGNVGIGVTDPTVRLALPVQAPLQVGYGYLSSEFRTGGQAFDIGVNYYEDGTGRVIPNPALGSADIVLRNDGALWYYQRPGGGSWRAPFGINTTGNVLIGIGAGDTGYPLSVNGNAYKQFGGPDWAVPSDLRLKKEVRPLMGALGKMLQLQGRTYRWKDPEQHGGAAGVQMGLIGQEVEKVFPEWVTVNEKGYRSLGEIGFDALTIEAIRELKQLAEAQQRRIEELNERVRELEGRATSSR